MLSESETQLPRAFSFFFFSSRRRHTRYWRDWVQTCALPISETLPGPRPELSPYAPRIVAFTIPVDKIGEVIGPKGKRINEIIATTGVEIDIEDDGTVRIGSKEGGSADEARRRIEELANPRMPQIGERFNGVVVKTAPFGAFVSLTPTKDGLVHISKLGGNIRLRRVEDVIAQGDTLEVEVTDIDPMGKISLVPRSEEHTSELQSRQYLVCRLLLEKKKMTEAY